MTINILPTEQVCANCRYYHQHYTYWPKYGNGYYPISCGHCSFPRIKHRKPCNTCDKWEEIKTGLEDF